MTVRVRIAPSPTGDPHVGTAYIGLINYCFAKRHGGKFILRVEDTDQSRCSPESSKAIYDSLRWLGLNYDEGPDVGGDFGPYTQSERVAQGIYQKYADQLIEQGDAYYCFCTSRDLEHMRKRQLAAGEPVMYDRRHRGMEIAEARDLIAKGEPYVVRMKTPLEGDHVYKDRLRKNAVSKGWKEIDDQVLLKSDGWPTYHLAAVVDDHLMGITHVIRAEEWLNSLPKHIWLNEKLGFTAPEYVHVGLLRNADKSKISKRKNPTSLLWYKKEGYLPEVLLNFLALLGHSMPDGRERFSVDELIAEFDLDRINVAGPVFDMAKLRFLQGQYFRDLSDPRVIEEVKRAVDERSAELLPLFRERMAFGGDWFGQAEPFFADKVDPQPEQLIPKGMDKDGARSLLEEIQTHVKRYVAKADGAWTVADLETFLRTLIEEQGAAETLETGAKPKRWNTKNVFMLLRIATTGRKDSPPLFDTLVQVGQLRVLERLGLAQQKLR